MPYFSAGRSRQHFLPCCMLLHYNHLDRHPENRSLCSFDEAQGRLIPGNIVLPVSAVVERSIRRAQHENVWVAQLRTVLRIISEYYGLPRRTTPLSRLPRPHQCQRNAANPLHLHRYALAGRIPKGHERHYDPLDCCRGCLEQMDLGQDPGRLLRQPVLALSFGLGSRWYKADMDGDSQCL